MGRVSPVPVKALAIAEFERHPSPLRYPGGKGKLANFVKLLMLENRLVGAEYVEPYAGGAGVALSLLFEEYASHVHINDLNRGIYAFWRAALEQTDELCERILRTPLGVSEWERQREVQVDPQVTDVDLAFSTFFLNRTSRSGIINGSGVIGGREQAGRWKIDARFNAEDLVRRIRRISRFRTRITVTGHDAKLLLTSHLPALGSNCFVYLDPPYYAKGAELYESAYEPEDHREIANVVRGLEVPWIVSYDATPAIKGLYSRYKSRAYSLRYTASTPYAGSELMFFHPKLRPPQVSSISTVSAAQVASAH